MGVSPCLFVNLKKFAYWAQKVGINVLYISNKLNKLVNGQHWQVNSSTVVIKLRDIAQFRAFVFDAKVSEIDPAEGDLMSNYDKSLECRCGLASEARTKTGKKCS